MKLKYYNPILPMLLTFTAAPFAALPASAAPINDAPFQELKTHDFQNRKPVEAINKMIRESANDGAAMGEIETKLIAVLEDPTATLGAKEEVGRMLRTMGTARSIPALSKLLPDERLNNPARYALERNSDPAAGKALRDALAVAKGKALLGVISSLGNRGEAAAVAPLKSFVTNPDAAVAEAAVSALGKIGTRDAVAILQALPNKKLFVYQALLSNASQMLQQGQTLTQQGQATRQGLAIYRQIMQDKASPTPARLAATRGILAGDPNQTVPLLLELLRGDDTDLRGLAVRYVREMPSGRNTDALIAAVDKLPVSGQAQLLSALADRRERTLLPVLMRLAAAPDATVRLAALRGFNKMEGNANAALVLAKTAATANNNAERDAARSSLYTLRGAAVDQAIITAIPQAEPTVRSELVLSLGQRNITNAKPTLFTLVGDTNQTVQNAAMSALGELSGAADYPTVVKLLIDTKSDAVRGSAESLVLRLSKQVPAEGERTAPLIAGYNGAPLDTKLSLLKVLGTIGGTTALNTLRLEMKNTDTQVQDAAIRALASAPDTEVMKDLLNIVQTDANKVHQVLALRGYLRLADAASTRPGATPSLAMYEPVLKLATEPQEKKTLVAGLGRINSPEALAQVSTMLDDEAVRNEAAQAVISIARSINSKNPKEAKAALDKVSTTVKDENILKQASEVSKNIKTD